MPIGRSRLGLRVFFGDGGDRVEADVGEEHDRRAGLDAVPAVGRERVPVRGVHVAQPTTTKKPSTMSLSTTIAVLSGRFRGCR